MLLTTTTQVPELEILSTAPTVVELGQAVEVHVRIAASQVVELLELIWNNPTTLLPDTAAPTMSFPSNLSAGDVAEGDVVFTTAAGRRDYGLMTATLRFRRQDGTEATASWEAWISVFPREHADAQELSDDHRNRLVSVVNAPGSERPHLRGRLRLVFSAISSTLSCRPARPDSSVRNSNSTKRDCRWTRRHTS